MDLLLNSATRKKEPRRNSGNDKKDGQKEEPFFQMISSSVTRKTTTGVSDVTARISEKDEEEEMGGGVTIVAGENKKGKEKEGGGGGKKKPKRSFTEGNSMEDALEVLKNEPDYDNLARVLRYLTAAPAPRDGGDSGGGGRAMISTPSPTAAQVARVLVAEIVPNYWAAVLREEEEEEESDSSIIGGSGSSGKFLLLASLQSITGVNAVLLRLAALTREAQKGHKERERREHVAMEIHVLLEVLAGVLEGEGKLLALWKMSVAGRNGDDEKEKMQRRIVWVQFMGLLAGDKIVGVCAEAEELGNRHVREGKEALYWVADGKEFSDWKAKNLTAWSRGLGKNGEGKNGDEEMKRVADLFAKSGKGFYGDRFTRQVLTELVFNNSTSLGPFKSLLAQLSAYEQQKAILMVLRLLAEKHLNSLGNDYIEEDPLVCAAAGLLQSIVHGDKIRTEYLISWLTGTSGAGLGDGIAIRRAVVVVLAENKDTVISALEKSMELFGDMIYVKHAPILQQEAHAQALLLLAGWVKRLADAKLTMLLRGTTFLDSVSNRLTAPQLRARFLGMVVGEALSALIDTGNKRLDFHMEETNSEEGTWYKSLLNIQDSIGDPTPLFTTPEKQGTTPQPPVKKPKAETKMTKSKTKSKTKTKVTQKATPPVSMPKTGFIIEELDDGDDSEDELDLTPYPKPASDVSDSEDDPTLVRRDKPKPPVYIRDLITFFQATDDHERQLVALRTAPSLIRRKAKFGTEVSLHAETLAGLLVGLEDKFEEDDDDDDDDEEREKSFEALRKDALVGLTVAFPQKMGPWLGRMLWLGDYSTAQRQTILVAMGLAGRELAGVDEPGDKDMFVSKRLPDRLERMFLNDTDDDEEWEGDGDMDTDEEGGTRRRIQRKGKGKGGMMRRRRRRKDLIPLPATALEQITHGLAQRYLAPMAAEAADIAAGPDALKLQTYKNRLATTTTTSSPSPPPPPPSSSSSLSTSTSTSTFPTNPRIIRHPKPRPAKEKPIPNTSATIICTYLFSPLCCRILPSLRSSSTSSSSTSSSSLYGRRSNKFDPILPLIVRTMAVLLHAAGPNTAVLPQLTAEFWGVLLALRQRCGVVGGGGYGAGNTGGGGREGRDMALLSAVVEGFVVLLQVNGVVSGNLNPITTTTTDGKVRQLCVDFGTEVSETAGWMALVFESLSGVPDERPSMMMMGGGGKKKKEEDKDKGGMMMMMGGDRMEEARVKAMAAGVLVRLQEVGERFRGLLLGLK